MDREVVQHFLGHYVSKLKKLGYQMEAICREDELGKTLEVTVRSGTELAPQIKEQIENGILPWVYGWQDQKYAVKVLYKT